MDSMTISTCRLTPSSDLVKRLPGFRLLSPVWRRMRKMISVTILTFLPTNNSVLDDYLYKCRLQHLDRREWKQTILKRTLSSQKTAYSSGGNLPLRLALSTNQMTLILNGRREVWAREMQAQDAMADPIGAPQFLLLARACQALSLKAKMKDSMA